MQERHQREKINHVKKGISLLEEDESLRELVRRKREQMAKELEMQTKNAEASLRGAQQDLQTSLSMVSSLESPILLPILELGHSLPSSAQDVGGFSGKQMCSKR